MRLLDYLLLVNIQMTFNQIRLLTTWSEDKKILEDCTALLKGAQEVFQEFADQQEVGIPKKSTAKDRFWKI